MPDGDDPISIKSSGPATFAPAPAKVLWTQVVSASINAVSRRTHAMDQPNLNRHREDWYSQNGANDIIAEIHRR
jgi:hypothetical protein